MTFLTIATKLWMLWRSYNPIQVFIICKSSNSDREYKKWSNKISFDVFERFPFKFNNSKQIKKGNGKCLVKDLSSDIGFSNSWKTQYNPIDVKSRVEHTQNNELSLPFTRSKTMKLNTFSSSTIQLFQQININSGIIGDN